jgi:hypothetical protein
LAALELNIAADAEQVTAAVMAAALTIQRAQDG